MNELSASSAEVATPSEIQVLILEPDEKVAMQIISAVEEAAPGTRARVADSLPAAQRLVVDQKPALFVLDVDATYDMGQEFIYDLRTSHPTARAIILTAIHFTAREQMSGLGAIHFLEKPFPRADFITLVEALLTSGGDTRGAGHFHGTLSDLHVADIVQLKCISGASSMLEFTGPRGEKARVYFENGQVRHATSPGKEGREAFDEIVDWKGGKIAEIPVPRGTPHTINLDWQLLLMEAVRKIDETRGAQAETVSAPSARPGQKVLVIDDSVMLLSFVKEILQDEGYDILTAETGEEGLRLAEAEMPDLILLDFVLPDIKGDEVCRRLRANAKSAGIPVIYVSGFGTDLQHNPGELPNVLGALHKPFTSDGLLATVRRHLGSGQPLDELKTKAGAADMSPRPGPGSATPNLIGPATAPAPSALKSDHPKEPRAEPQAIVSKSAGIYFSGDSSFFSLHRALQTIARKKLSGVLRALWASHCVELLAREGGLVLVTTSDPSLYAGESPATPSDLPLERIEAARVRQAADGCPLFLTLANEGLILRDTALRLVDQYGQRLFSKLWTNRVRFTFEQDALPDYANELPSAPDEIDQWALSTLRLVQYEELDEETSRDPVSIPAYTRDGLERAQRLRFTAAEAQYASQFNGSRSIAQIAKKLRLDRKSSHLTLFRFLALEIVECWPVPVATRSRTRSIRGLFGGQD